MRTISAGRIRCPHLFCFLLTLGVATATLLAPGAVAAEEDAARPPKTVRLLTVGNSFSQNATQYLDDLATAAGNVLVHHQATIGGASLAQHWEKAKRHEDDPEDPLGLYSTNRSLKQELRAERWDFVTIQQASFISHDLSTYRPYARWLFDEIKRHAPQAEVLVHQTWAYRSDDPRFAAGAPRPGKLAGQEAMYQGLTASYGAIAAELGVRIIPVGDAFHRADTDPMWGYRPDSKFDRKVARPPALPEQTHSLHVGWRWVMRKDDKDQLLMDGHHANEAGKYLGACVFYEVLFGEIVVGNPFVPPIIDASYARFLQETAHRAVARSPVGGSKPSRTAPPGAPEDSDGEGPNSLRVPLPATEPIGSESAALRAP